MVGSQGPEPREAPALSPQALDPELQTPSRRAGTLSPNVETVSRLSPYEAQVNGERVKLSDARPFRALEL